MNTNEIIGRLWIWEESLSKTKYLLNLAFRANQEKDQQNTNGSFPSRLECCGIYETCIELAVVYFCQIFTSGEEKAEMAAKNDEDFRRVHLERIISEVFDTEDKKNNFATLKKALKTARDKIIAHADAKSFKIGHGDSISVMKGNPLISRNIDIEFWESFLEPMETKIKLYSAEFKYINKKNHN
ncbi:MAG: hypothetical protein ACXVPN_03865 [Bacteroidia bacterium]